MERDIREKITTVLMFNSKSTEHFTEMKGAIDKDQLDLMEAYKAIVENSYSRTRSGDFICTQCDKTAYLLKKINHDKNCIVLKAEQYLRS